MKRPVKVAILGGGWFGNYHLDHLLTMEGVEVAALATGNAQRLAGLSKKAPQAHTYSDQQTLLENEPDLDAVIVCVPPDSHQGIERQVAKRGIHLYMEKPLGVSLTEIRDCEKVIQESGIICSVGYQTRYNPCLTELKAFLRERKIGTAAANWIGVMPQTPWWRVKERSGGQLHEQVTHMIDLLRYLCGDVRSVYSAARTGLITGVPNYNVEDCSASVFTFECGLLVNVLCGCYHAADRERREARIQFFGDTGRAEYEWDQMARWGDCHEEKIVRFGDEFHYPALQTFIEAVRTGDASTIRSPYADAAKTFLATWAANISMETHREIFLNEL